MVCLLHVSATVVNPQEGALQRIDISTLLLKYHVHRFVLSSLCVGNLVRLGMRQDMNC